MKFLLFHGAFGSPGSNWLPELKDKLESLGQEVIAPAFPVETWEYITRTGDKISSQQQNLDNWLAEFDKVYKTFRKGEKLVFIGHSLGPLFILHIVERYNIKVDCAIFVCPFLEKLHKSWQIDHVNQSFYKTNFDFRKLKKLIPVSYVLYSNDDPYVDQKYSELFGNALASSMILLKRAGHMNSEVNLNDFPLIMDLCITRLELPLYQRYLSLKEKLGLTEYVEKTKGSRVKINAEEALAEGVFRFRNLVHNGFFTFFTPMVKFWDPHSQYMRDARAAATRGKHLTRVFIVDKASDLKSKLLREQILLDFTAGIHIYLCKYADIKDSVTIPDFGITDDSYVCFVPYNKKTKKAEEIELNSSREALDTARQWKIKILNHAMEMNDYKRDLLAFQRIFSTHSK
ncbi:MAG: DUF6879 family protein [Patescibacteria group bacterium]